MRRSAVFLVACLGFLAACAPAEGAPLNAEGLTTELRRAGVQVDEVGPVEQPFLSVDGIIVRVDGQDVQVFEYPDAASRQADSDQISPDGSSIGTTMVTWVDTPHFWARDSLIVLYVGQDEATISALDDVLGEAIAGG